MRRQVEVAGWAPSKVLCSQSPVPYRHKLRAHKKSRGGCQNCKLRSIKCDESRPHCKRCLSYGVHCNFVNGVPELQLAAPGAMHIIEPRCRALPVAKYGPRPCKEAALLAKFQNTVAMTVSLGKRLTLFQNEIVALSDTYPSLKHTIISLTLMHDRHELVWSNPGMFRPKCIPSLSEHEIGHWYLATSCFNTDLTLALTNTTHRYLDIRQQAALYATSVLLAVLTFCYIEARTLEEAWPLAGGPSPSNLGDLQWIRMSNGEISAQTLTRGLATDSVFRPLVLIDEQDKSTFPSYSMTVPAIECECFLELEQLMCGPEIEALMRIANSNCFITIILSFWSFVGGMTVEFECYLRHKKPAALLVLLYWYAKLNPIPVWWLKARTTLEGQAICTYLDRYHGHDLRLKKLLRWPTSVLLGST